MLLKGLFDVVVTTYETVVSCEADLRHFVWRYVILDEGHRIKNEETQWHKVGGQAHKKSKTRRLPANMPIS